MLTTSEQRVLRAFQQFRMVPGQMLCFNGPELKTHKSALRNLTEREFLVEEQFEGGYSLTREGFAAMKDCG